MNGEHRAGVSEAYLVKRHLRIETLEPGSAESLCDEINRIIGIDSVAIDPQTRQLDIAYDASVLNIDDIEAVFTRNGVAFAHGWWNRTKLEHYRFVDQNVRDNAKADPHCCSKPPPGH